MSHPRRTFPRMAVPMTAMHNDDTVSDDELCDSYVADQREITRLHASAAMKLARTDQRRAHEPQCSFRQDVSVGSGTRGEQTLGLLEQSVCPAAEPDEGRSAAIGHHEAFDECGDLFGSRGPLNLVRVGRVFADWGVAPHQPREYPTYRFEFSDSAPPPDGAKSAPAET